MTSSFIRPPYLIENGASLQGQYGSLLFESIYNGPDGRLSLTIPPGPGDLRLKSNTGMNVIFDHVIICCCCS